MVRKINGMNSFYAAIQPKLLNSCNSLPGQLRIIDEMVNNCGYEEEKQLEIESPCG
jgi:hypothetical protein